LPHLQWLPCVQKRRAALVDLIISTLCLITVLRLRARGNDIADRNRRGKGYPCVRRRTGVNYFDRTNFLVNYPDMIITDVATLMYRCVLAPSSLCEIVYILPCYAANIKMNTLGGQASPVAR